MLPIVPVDKTDNKIEYVIDGEDGVSDVDKPWKFSRIMRSETDEEEYDKILRGTLLKGTSFPRSLPSPTPSFERIVLGRSKPISRILRARPSSFSRIWSRILMQKRSPEVPLEEEATRPRSSRHASRIDIASRMRDNTHWKHTNSSGIDDEADGVDKYGKRSSSLPRFLCSKDSLRGIICYV